MAKMVIAGHSDCPYFARIELLGDQLVKNLPSFQLHKIIKTPEEWKTWLNQTCQERGWHHETSPIVWRELIDRGGKGVLIGGASDFQEYVKGYYDLESQLTSVDMQKIALENFQTKKEIDAEDVDFKALSKPMHVCITAASSAMCYSLLPAIVDGQIFGQNTEINLRLYDIPSANLTLLQAVAMEMQDLCSGLLRGIEVLQDRSKAFQDCTAVIILDELLQGEEEDYDNWIQRNCDFFSDYARVINSSAKKTVRVLVAGNGPVNFNVMMMIKNAPDILRQNIVALSCGVENRAKAVIAKRLNVNTAGVVDLIIWGSINGKHYVDVSMSRVHGYDGAVWGPPFYYLPVVEAVHDEKWLEKEYLELVQQRLNTVETALGHSATCSAAHAITTTLKYWWNGSPLGQIFSLGVCSEGWYDVPEGLVFSYPVTLSPKGYWVVVQDILLTDKAKEKIQEAIMDLTKEMEVIYPPPKPPTPPQPEEAEQELKDEETAQDQADEETAANEPEEKNMEPNGNKPEEAEKEENLLPNEAEKEVDAEENAAAVEDADTEQAQ